MENISIAFVAVPVRDEPLQQGWQDDRLKAASLARGQAGDRGCHAKQRSNAL